MTMDDYYRTQGLEYTTPEPPASTPDTFMDAYRTSGLQNTGPLPGLVTTDRPSLYPNAAERINQQAARPDPYYEQKLNSLVLRGTALRQNLDEYLAAVASGVDSGTLFSILQQFAGEVSHGGVRTPTQGVMQQADFLYDQLEALYEEVQTAGAFAGNTPEYKYLLDQISQGMTNASRIVEDMIKVGTNDDVQKAAATFDGAMRTLVQAVKQGGLTNQPAIFSEMSQAGKDVFAKTYPDVFAKLSNLPKPNEPAAAPAKPDEKAGTVDANGNPKPAGAPGTPGYESGGSTRFVSNSTAGSKSGGGTGAGTGGGAGSKAPAAPKPVAVWREAGTGTEPYLEYQGKRYPFPVGTKPESGLVKSLGSILESGQEPADRRYRWPIIKDLGTYKDDMGNTIKIYDMDQVQNTEQLPPGEKNVMLGSQYGRLEFRSTTPGVSSIVIDPKQLALGQVDLSQFSGDIRTQLEAAQSALMASREAYEGRFKAIEVPVALPDGAVGTVDKNADNNVFGGSSVKVVDPDTGSTTWRHYDTNGNLASVTTGPDAPSNIVNIGGAGLQSNEMVTGAPQKTFVPPTPAPLAPVGGEAVSEPVPVELAPTTEELVPEEPLPLPVPNIATSASIWAPPPRPPMQWEFNVGDNGAREATILNTGEVIKLPDNIEEDEAYSLLLSQGKIAADSGDSGLTATQQGLTPEQEEKLLALLAIE